LVYASQSLTTQRRVWNIKNLLQFIHYKNPNCTSHTVCWIIPKISFEDIACPLMKSCFTNLELLSVQRYAARKSSSSYIESQWGVQFCVSFLEQGIWAIFFAEHIITGTLHTLTLWICGWHYNLKKIVVKHSPSNKITHSSTSQFFNKHKHGRWIEKGRPTEWPYIPRSTSITLSF